MSRESALPVRNREWWATTTGMNGLNFDEYNVDVTKLILSRTRERTPKA